MQFVHACAGRARRPVRNRSHSSPDRTHLAGAGPVASPARWVRSGELVATIFEPASERGQRGMDELHQQTVSCSRSSLYRKMCTTRRWRSIWWRARAEERSPRSIPLKGRIARHYRAIAGDCCSTAFAHAAAGSHLSWLRASRFLLKCNAPVDVRGVVAIIGRRPHRHAGR